MRFLSTPNPQPASFATYSYFGNNCFIFVNARGERHATRYQILPLAGEQHLDPAVAAAREQDFLCDELRSRLARAPVEFRLQVQIANPTDPTSDATLVWPDDRKSVLGTIRLTSVDPKSAEAEKGLTYDPTHRPTALSCPTTLAGISRAGLFHLHRAPPKRSMTRQNGWRKGSRMTRGDTSHAPS
jgi:catalase